MTQMTPASSRRAFAFASPKRATATTSLCGARDNATGSPTWPVAPVSRMRLPFMEPFYSVGRSASIRPSTTRHG